MPRTDLLAAGESFQDLIFVGLPHMPRGGEELRTPRFVATVGGGALITAMAASRLGLRTGVVSALSAEARRVLRAARVRFVDLKMPEEADAVTVALSTARDRGFVTFDGVNRKLESRLPAALAGQHARHIHLAFAPRDCRRWTQIVERLRARGVTTSWDFGWTPRLRGAAGFAGLVAAADLVFVNEAEAALYAGTRHAAAAVSFWRGGARNTIVKLGSRGSRWIGEGHAMDEAVVAAPRVRTVDTTGAGDAFNGGFLTAWLGGQPRRQCLRLGNFVGAQSTRAPGGIASLPMRRSGR